MPTPTDVHFDETTFSRWFAQISAIGATAQGGVHRPFGSEADRHVRQWLLRTAQDLNLSLRIDEIGNIWGVRAGQCELPAIAIGSHHDSVPQGGRFDGPLGVLAGLAVIHALDEAGVALRHPLAFVSFTAEEPNPFNLSTLGSRTVSGKLTTDVLMRAQTPDGVTLDEAIAAVGGDLSQAACAQLSSRDLSAFLELHIEQGLRLVRASTALGVVTGICGIYRERIEVIGEANHAGTTLLSDRHDALLAGAEIALAVEQAVAARQQDDVIGTVGTFSISPGAINIIPGVCELVVELRAGTRDTMQALQVDLDARLQAIAQTRGVDLRRTVLLDQMEQPLDSTLRQTLTASARDLCIPCLDLFSMAGHDATHIASFTRAAMLFVPSQEGKSHCPEEFTRMEDIARAADVLIRTVLVLDQILD